MPCVDVHIDVLLTRMHLGNGGWNLLQNSFRTYSYCRSRSRSSVNVRKYAALSCSYTQSQACITNNVEQLFNIHEYIIHIYMNTQTHRHTDTHTHTHTHTHGQVYVSSYSLRIVCISLHHSQVGFETKVLLTLMSQSNLTLSRITSLKYHLKIVICTSDLNSIAHTGCSSTSAVNPLSLSTP